jgi:8-amino-7-oxononanoate synthase
MFNKRFINRLALQKQAGLYRNPPEIKSRVGKHICIANRKLLNFSSNDYLGLSSSRTLNKKVANHFEKLGMSSSSSRLVSGNYEIINQAEKVYAEYFGYEDALFYPSGFQANIGVISTLFEPGDHVIFDKHIHASSVKGIQLSRAAFTGYRHNSISHLKKKLEKINGKQAAVITESLFSMDGDYLPVKEIAELKAAYNFLSIVDEAHAFAAVGPKGRGIAKPVADIAIGTFGKAFGFLGAFVLLPKTIKAYLLNFSAALIYSTTLPEAHAAAAIDILEQISESDQQRSHLQHISKYMKQSIIQAGLNVSGDAHILAIEIGDEKKAAEISRELYSRDIFVFPARYPTVPLGKAILRISMTALHTEKDVDLFVNKLKETI